MCHSAAQRSIAKSQANALRCASCYKPAPYHRKHCALVAATIESAQSAKADALPSYTDAISTPTAVVYESRHRPHGPIGFAVRWGIKKVQERRDQQKFVQQSEEHRRMERDVSSSSPAPSAGETFEVVDQVWEHDEKRVETEEQIDSL